MANPGHEMLSPMDFEDPKKSYELIEKMWKLLDHAGISAKETLQFTDEMMEELYQMAYHLYTTQKIPEALEAFKYLTSLDHRSYRYALGMAGCHHQLKNYQEAIAWYSIAMINDASNPTPAHFATECALELKVYQSAKFYSDQTILRSGNKEEFAPLKNHALLLRRGIDQKLTENSP